MVAPLEVMQEPAPWSRLPAARAFLLGYVRTDVPGYRELPTQPAGGELLAVVASSTGYRFDSYLAAIEAAKTGGQDAWTWASTGRVTGAGAGDPVLFSDRLGWVCGFGGEPGDGIVHESGDFVPPAGIPLLGFTWTEIRHEVDRQRIIDQHRRNQGYAFGRALIAQCKLTMHRWALGALLTGWCLRGKVTIGSLDALDVLELNSGDAGGALTGYVLGIDSARWLTPTEEFAEVLLSISYQEY